eukprot:4314132-Alexandrium_andersonii.AAC.1
MSLGLCAMSKRQNNSCAILKTAAAQGAEPVATTTSLRTATRQGLASCLAKQGRKPNATSACMSGPWWRQLVCNAIHT